MGYYSIPNCPLRVIKNLQFLSTQAAAEGHAVKSGPPGPGPDLVLPRDVERAIFFWETPLLKL